MLSFLNSASDRTAVHFQDGTLSYAQLNKLLKHAVAELDAMNLPRDARMATILPNSLELLVCYYACLLRGIVMVPINNRLTVPETDRILEAARPHCVITTRAVHRKLGADSEQPEHGVPVVVWEDIHRWLDIQRPARSLPVPELCGEEPAILFYTSGSTGDPKGVVYSWRTLRETTRLYRQAYAITDRDSSVLCHCFSHNFVLTLMTLPFLDAGGTVHVVDFGDVPQTAAALKAGVTFLCVIPWLGYQLMEHFRGRSTAGLELRTCLVGGDRVPADFFTDFENVFGVMPAEMLGMTETNIYVTNPLKAGDLRLGSVGKPLPESEVSIRDADGRPLGANQTGEIWVRTPMSMSGYWRNPEQTRRTMTDGWVATGDAGHLDADGYLWFTGRIKHIIICDGDNVYPKEVENAIGEHPAVSQACVVGIPHASRGETVGAAVTLERDSGDLTLDRLEEFLAGRLAETKRPKKLLVLDELPQTANGKLDREAVSALLAD